jgi:hypothetical protein
MSPMQQILVADASYYGGAVSDSPLLGSRSISASPANVFPDTFVGRVIGEAIGCPIAVLSPNNVNPLTGYVDNFSGDKKVDVFMSVVPFGALSKTGGTVVGAAV